VSYGNGNNGNGNGDGRVTFDEVRRMARWLGLFGPSDLADALRCHPEVAERGILALRAHRLLLDTGEQQDGPDGEEEVWEMVPLPDTVYPRDKRTPPEVVAVMQSGGFLLYDERGVPVRLRADSDMRRVLSTPGARKFHRERERAYERQQRAIRQRAEVSSRRAKNFVPKWKRKSAAKIALAEQGVSQ
jgi:hypothetical protein